LGSCIIRDLNIYEGDFGNVHQSRGGKRVKRTLGEGAARERGQDNDLTARQGQPMTCHEHGKNHLGKSIERGKLLKYSSGLGDKEQYWSRVGGMGKREKNFRS